MKAVVAVFAALIVVSTLVGLLGGGGAVPAPPAGAAVNTAPAAAPAACAAPSIAGLDAKQVAIAKVGVDAALSAGTGVEGARIIVSAGLVESELRDLDYGDRDSIGWLQQRPSTGWRNAGDPAKAAVDFLAALKRIPGWKSLDPGVAAQRVQRSAHPERYGRRMAQAEAIVAAITKAKCVPAAAAPTGSCPPSGVAAERGLRPAALRGIRCGAAAFPKLREFGGRGGRPNKSDHPNGLAVDFMVPAWKTPSGRQYGWDVARWFQANAAQMNVTYLIYDDKKWSTSRAAAGWRAYTHPNGPTRNPTLRHLDHVHVSFKEG